MHNAPESSLLTRREAVRNLSAAALLALGLWPGRLRALGATPPAEEFTFIAVNDVHYKTPECGAWFQGVVDRMREERPAFCLLVGDIADRGSRETHSAMRDVLSTLDAPVYVQIGNHDYATHTDRAAYEEIFPGRINYRFDHGAWQFVGLDSTEGTHYKDTLISDATLRWIDDELPKLDRTRPLVLFTHFPLADGVKMQPKNANALLERFREHNLQAVFNGHFHGYTEHTFEHATVTTNRCCSLKVDNHDGTHEKGFFVCTAREGRVTRRFVQVPVPTAAT
jgi:predicted MPP superfamily phosphohydrolase